MRDAVEIARSLQQALEAGRHGDDLSEFFAPDAFTVEHPNVLNPTGGRASLDEMRAASTSGAELLREQHYDVIWSATVGTTAVMQVTWTGVIGRDAGPFSAGQLLTAHLAQFVHTDGERITSIETYDCYEPFSTG